MYNLVNEVTKKKGVAFLSAILYMIFPYRFECLFNRFAIGEFTAFVFIPIVFQGLYNLLQGDKKKALLYSNWSNRIATYTHNIYSLHCTVLLNFCAI